MKTAKKTERNEEVLEAEALDFYRQLIERGLKPFAAHRSTSTESEIQ
jgi:hypothetical protein